MNKITFQGAGLSTSLCALKLLDQGNSQIELYDSRESRPIKTWSCFDFDVPEDSSWFDSIPQKRWDSYDVFFPEYHRNVKMGYRAISSESFFQYVEKQNAVRYEPSKVPSSFHFNGIGLSAKDFGPCGYQKFVGLQLSTKRPHGLKNPILMDARVKQIDGFRFLYVLPWDENRLLVEDTVYSDSPNIDTQEFEERIVRYTESHWGPIDSIQNELTERAALPIPLTTAYLAAGEKKAIGVQGGLFQPVTGYSLPYAIRGAIAVSKDLENSSANTKTSDSLVSLKQTTSEQARFLIMLNKMMFGAAPPEERIRIFQRFYRLSVPLIHRFYSGELTLADKLRILTGKPPVSVGKAIQSLATKKWMSEFAHAF